MDQISQVLTAQEVAKILKVSESKAYTMMRQEMKCVRLGRTIRVRVEDLEQYIRSKTVAPPAPFC